MTQRLSSFNEYREHHPDAGVAAYTHELARHRMELLKMLGITSEKLHEEFPKGVTQLGEKEGEKE